MKYDEALRLWGKYRIEQQINRGRKNIIIVPDSVTVSMDFNEGYVCCGPNNRDDSCYCSFAESPSANVKIFGTDKLNGAGYSVEISHYEFGFAQILQEIVMAGDGVLEQ